MKKDIKSIQGQQLVPNPIGPECINVTKVYDWVVLTNRDRNKVPIPAECFAEIESCRSGGGVVTATCEEVAGTRRCDVMPGSRPAPGVPGGRIVTIAFNVRIRIQFFCDGAMLCGFEVPVSFVDEVILCFPEGTTVVCNIFDVNCTVLADQMLGNMLLLEVVMCKDVQVEAQVKLEVQAKFCGPRTTIPIDEQPFECPFPTFPEQCPTFFPPLNCECQGAADFSGEATILVGGLPTAGQLDLLAFICDACNPENSRLEVDYDDTAAIPPTPTPDTPGDQSFTFTATEIAQPTCTVVTVGGVDLVTGLVTTGTGVFTPAGGVPVNATFTLTLVDGDVIGGGPDLVTLTITPAGFLLPTTIALTSLTNPGLEVEAGDCDRFPDIPTTTTP
jgi:hypothetical protein